MESVTIYQFFIIIIILYVCSLCMYLGDKQHFSFKADVKFTHNFYCHLRRVLFCQSVNYYLFLLLLINNTLSLKDVFVSLSKLCLFLLFVFDLMTSDMIYTFNCA